MTLTIDRPGTETVDAPAPADAIVLPYSQALLDGLFAVALHTKADVTPSLGAVEVSGRYFTATNRYTIGRFEHTTPAEWVTLHGADAGTQGTGSGATPDERAVLIPRKVADELVKLTAKKLEIVDPSRLSSWDGSLSTVAYSVAFTPTNVTVRWGVAGAVLTSIDFDAVDSRFPPVARLFPDDGQWFDAPAGYTPNLLTLFARGAERVNDSKLDPMHLHGTVEEPPSWSPTEPEKHGPTIVSFGPDKDAAHGFRFRGLLMPHIKPRR
ncbi:hypothetical protein [Agromyces humi]|uniref:hypothetical protein n=1 Tax=Agromyces humi TaxID=1766800 RepID=UPI00135BBDB1|nr:hypothetical protein [Agromyces humi]